MDATYDSIPDEVLRHAIRLSVKRVGLRKVARELGLSPSGLAKSLEQGSNWYGPTRRRVVHWYVRRDKPAGEPDPETIGAVVAILAEAFPPDQREAAVLEFAAELHAIHVRRGTEIPRWLQARVG